LWASPEGAVRVYEKCRWDAAGKDPTVDDTAVIVEHAGGTSLSMETLGAIRTDVARRTDAIPGVISGPGLQWCRPAFAEDPRVPCMRMGVKTPQVLLSDLAGQVTQLLSGVQTDGCFLLEIQVGEAERALLGKS
jgi:hypothetical protein